MLWKRDDFKAHQRDGYDGVLFVFEDGVREKGRCLLRYLTCKTKSSKILVGYLKDTVRVFRKKQPGQLPSRNKGP